MTKDDFLRSIQANRIRLDAFNLDGRGNECYVVVQREGGWAFYYSERGLESGVCRFLTESAALEYLFEKLRADPTTRL